MKCIDLFNNLHGTTVTREELEKLGTLAFDEQQWEVHHRVSQLLNKFPDATKFQIDISAKVIEGNLGYSLAGVLDDSIEQEALHGIDFIDEGDIDHHDIASLGRVTPKDIYKMITDRIVEAFKEKDTPAYKKTWKARVYGQGYLIPFNFVTKKRYRGVNVLLLTNSEPLENPFYLTFKQIEKLGGQLKKGSKGRECVYYTQLYKVEIKERNINFATYKKEVLDSYVLENGIQEKDIQTLPIIRYYNVFNGKDIDGIDFDLDNFKIGYIESELKAGERIKIADLIVKHYPDPAPRIYHGGNRAYYQPGTDKIQMPNLVDFDTSQDYYRTLFHELAHSTGSVGRLKRDFSGRFGSKKYAKEELIAEWGSVFLSAEGGIVWHSNSNHVAYMKSWNTALTYAKEDTRFLMRAATQAQKLADFVLQYQSSGDPLYMKHLKPTTDKIEIVKPEGSKKDGYPFSKDDIDYKLAYNAHSGTSFSPEKRAVSEQEGYFETLKKVYDSNKAKATNSDLEKEFESKFERFKNGYLKRYIAYLSSRNGLMSTMITGPANFPVARMQKKSQIVDKRMKELIDYVDKYQNFFKPQSDIIKTGSSEALTKLEAKLKQLQDRHEAMKKGNAIITKVNKTNLSREEKVKEIANQFKSIFSEKEILDWVKYVSRFNDTLLHYKFFLTNSNAKIKRVLQQIELEKNLIKTRNEKGNKEYSFKDGKIVLNRDINKIQIHFDGKPDVEIRNFIKKAGQAFKWSPKMGVWQRQLNTFSQYSAKALFKYLNVDEEKPSENKKENLKVKKDKDPKTHNSDFEKRHGISSKKAVEILNNGGKIPDKSNDFYCDLLLEAWNSGLKVKKGKIRATDCLINYEDVIVKKPIIKKMDGLESLVKITSNDPIRYAITGVYVDEDYLVATDAHKLVRIKTDSHTKEDGKIINVKQKISGMPGMYVNATYPKYKSVIPIYQNKTDFIPIDDLLEHAYTASRISLMTDAKLPFKMDSINFVDASLLYEVLLTLKQNGSTKIKLSASTSGNRAIIIETPEDHLALLMPIMEPNREKGYKYKFILDDGLNEVMKSGLRGPKTKLDLFSIQEKSKKPSSAKKKLGNTFYNDQPQVPEPKNISQALSNAKKMTQWAIKQKKTNKDQLQILNEALKVNKTTSPKNVEDIIFDLKLENLLAVASEFDWVLTFLIENKNKPAKKLGTVLIPVQPQAAPNTPVYVPPVQQENIAKPAHSNVKAPKYHNSLVKGLKEARNASKSVENFKLEGALAEFLGPLEKKHQHSLVITLDAPPGSGKTRSVFQFLNMVANSGYNSVFASLEEHPESRLFHEKTDLYIDSSNEDLIAVFGDLPETWQEFKRMIEPADVIAIDSWNKVYEKYKVDFDNDLRKALDGKLIIVIFQRTADGKMRGGSRAAFDGDIILEVVPDADYRNSFLQARKNRYQDTPLNEIGYNIFNQKVINPETINSLSLPAEITI